MAIKLIATDLDGTLFREDRTLSEKNTKALKSAISNGIEVVIATGRALVTIPDEVKDFEGLNYLITSNGANVIDAKTKEPIYTKHISVEGINSVWEYLVRPELMIEIFYKGHAYMDRKFWDNVEHYGAPPRFAEYVRETRNPVDDFASFLNEHKGEIENINLVFASQENRLATWAELTHFPLVNVTSSLHHNVEIGPLGVSKADGLEHICEHEKILPTETICIGDNANDLTMIEFAGIGIAMENAVDEVKAAADYITLSNDEDGVAFALEKFLR